MNERDESAELPPALATVWENAAAEALLRHVPLAELTGTVLVAEVGDGDFARRVLEKATQARRVMFVDTESDRLDRVRVSAADFEVGTYFNHEGVRELSFAPDVFDAAFCVRSIITAADALNVLASLSTVVRVGGYVCVAGLGPRTLLTFDEMLVEAVYAADSPELSAALSDHRERRLSDEDFTLSAQRFEITPVASGSESVAVEGHTAEQMLCSPLVVTDLAPAWRAVDESVRELGTSFSDAVGRMRVFYNGARIDDALELVWFVGRVGEAEAIAVDEEDVLGDA